jgi:hypothetical protein
MLVGDWDCGGGGFGEEETGEDGVQEEDKEGVPAS